LDSSDIPTCVHCLVFARQRLVQEEERELYLIVLFFKLEGHDFSLLLVLEFCPNGTLLDKIHKKQHQQENKEEQQEDEEQQNVFPKYLAQIAAGMAYLHQRKFIHRDVTNKFCFC
jgi:serine/threonine protein kinase